MKDSIGKIKKKFKAKNRFFIVALVFILIILFTSFKEVEIGYQGILYNSMAGKVSPGISPGWHVVIPFVQKLTLYPINDRTYKICRDNKNWNNGIDASIVTPTYDNQKISIDITFVYALDKERMSYIYETFDGLDISTIESGYLDDIFKASIINTVSQYSAYDVYSTKRSDIQSEIFEDLTKKLIDIGIKLKYLYIDTVRLSTETESIIKAVALAEATRIEAQAKSDANKLISESLTDKVITYESLSKLSESLRLIVVPSGTDSQLDFSKILEQILSEAENPTK